MTPKTNEPREVTDKALEDVVGGAGHELTHVTQQSMTAQFNPKELSVDKSVPWQRAST